MYKNKKNIRVLFLSAWYPSKEDYMLGLFVERHALAVSKKCDIAVLYVQASDNEQYYSVKPELQKKQGINEIIIYYKNHNTRIPLISGLIKIWKYFSAYYKGFKLVKRHFGDFDLIHVNILTRTGIVAFIKKYFSGKPYIISEHWSRYLNVNNTYKGFVRKSLTRLIVRKASAVITVTDELKDAMLKYKLINKQYHIVPNVIDTDLFIIKSKYERSVKKFIHISCFEDKSKNISGIIHAIATLAKERNDFIVDMVGTGQDFNTLKQLSDKLELTDKIIFFKGLLENEALVENINQSVATILFSNYETFGIVPLECMACGVPVISTKTGIINNVFRNEMGLLTDIANQEQLVIAMKVFLNNEFITDREKLRSFVKANYSVEIICDKFLNIYSQALKK